MAVQLLNGFRCLHLGDSHGDGVVLRKRPYACLIPPCRCPATGGLWPPLITGFHRNSEVADNLSKFHDQQATGAGAALRRFAMSYCLGPSMLGGNGLYRRAGVCHQHVGR
jgi:hypothetical protein